MSEKLALWRSVLQGALERNKSLVFSRYCQLATVNQKGNPTNRTVVFRGFQPETNNLLIITYIRSEKINHLQQNPQAEICWYFTKTREQFRISGLISIVFFDTNNADLIKLRKEIWQRLSAKAKEQFTWANPGELINSNNQINQDNINLENPVNNFCLLILKPDQVDHLQLKGDPQNRHFYLLVNDEWQVNQVNP